MRARLPMLSLALVASLALSACGQEAQDEGGLQTEISIVAETEAIYVDLDGLKYQVQVSRQMNPGAVDDRAYFAGIPEDQRELAEDEEWFGIWMRAENNTKEPQLLSKDFEIRDTQENVFRPVEYGPDNPFAYRPVVVQKNEDYPDPNSAAGERQPQGALILFKIPRFAFDNRPLELIYVGPKSGERASVALDI